MRFQCRLRRLEGDVLRVIARLEASPLSRKGSIPNVRKTYGNEVSQITDPLWRSIFIFFSTDVCKRCVCHTIKVFLNIYKDRKLIKQCINNVQCYRKIIQNMKNLHNYNLHTRKLAHSPLPCIKYASISN